jgi:DNA primase
VEVLVASLSPGQDPDSLLAKKGPLAITQALLGAREYLTFLWEHYSKTLHTSSPAEKNMLVQELVQKIREWDNTVMVHESLKKLSALTQVPEELLGIDVLQPRTIYFKRSLGNNAPQQVDPDRILEQDLMRWLLLCGQGSPELVDLAVNNIKAEDLRQESAKKLYQTVTDALLAKKEIHTMQLAIDLGGEDGPLFLSEILNKKVNRDKAREQLTDTILRIKERNWMHERESIKMKIHSGKANDDELMQLVKQFDDLKKKTPAIV